MKKIAQENHQGKKERSGLSGFGAFSILRKLENYGACAGKDGSPNCSRKGDAMKTERHEPETGGLKKISNFFKGRNFLGLNHYNYGMIVKKRQKYIMRTKSGIESELLNLGEFIELEVIL